MTRMGLTPDELLVATWAPGRRPAYAARAGGLNVLRGETVALTGGGTGRLLDELGGALDSCVALDGATAAAGGVLRVHAQRAARAGARSLTVTEPFRGLDGAGRALAVADLAGLSDLGLTTVVQIADAALAALAADRVAVVRDGEAVVSYPVLAPVPRTPDDVGPVAARLRARLSRD